MQTQDIAGWGGFAQSRDVGKPQPANLHNLWCLSQGRQVIVSSGRTQAADTSHLGRRAEQSAKPTPQETRSRGCRRARKQFSHFARLSIWQPAVQKSRKPSILKTRPRSQPNRPTQANTSNSEGRAFGAARATLALFLTNAHLGGAV